MREKINEKEPLVSIVMPAFNVEKYIHSAVSSVIRQYYQNWELLIVDDNSADRTVEIIQLFVRQDSRIQYLKNIHEKGAAGARKTATENAHGDYIAFLDADDLWPAEKLSRQIGWMRQHNIDFCYGFYETIDAHGKIITRLKAPKSVGVFLMRCANFLCNSTVIYHCAKTGKFRQPIIQKRYDYALWFLILRSGVRAHCCTEFLAQHRRRPDALSNDKFWVLLRFYRQVMHRFGGVGKLSAVLLMFVYLPIIFVKKKIPRLYNFLCTAGGRGG